MREIGEKLLLAVSGGEPRLRQIGAAESLKPILTGGWSRNEVIGHLIDSASNNHQRFVRAALEGSLEWPGYEQGGWVRVEAPQEAEWTELISLWAAYNRYLAHVIARLPESKAGTPCRIGAGDAATLGVRRR